MEEQGAPQRATGCTRFVPFKSHIRECRPSAQEFKKAQEDLAKQRTQDGVTVCELREHLASLKSDGPDTAAWLARILRLHR